MEPGGPQVEWRHPAACGSPLLAAGWLKPFFGCELAAEVSASLVLAAPLGFEGDAGVA